MVKVDALVDPEECLEVLKNGVAWAERLHLAYAWATSSNGSAEHWRALPLAKVDKAVIGLDFDATEPHVLRKLQGRGVLRIARGSGVFHPKLCLMSRGGEVRALIGSSNFTVGGFGQNTEVNVLISGSAGSATLKKLMAFVLVNWRGGAELDDKTLAEYEARYVERESFRKVGLPSAAPDGEPESSAVRMGVKTALEGQGILEFLDSPEHVGEKTKAFMDWCDIHPQGLYLTKKSGNKYRLHRVGCWHVGDRGNYESGPKADTKPGTWKTATGARKLCADEHAALWDWAGRENVHVHRCRTCAPPAARGE